MIGTLLKDRYRIEAKLGEGGMGVVYRAHDTTLDRPVAIKVLSPQVVGDGAERLLREARSVAQLDHPHIVGVHDAGEIGGQPFIVMQLATGKTLRELSPSLDEAVEATKQICLALEYAHGKGVVHRDIKPENVLVTGGGTVKVMDFGLARSEGRSRLTQPGMIVGTVAYMAPEQVLRGEADARTDLYGLGCVLYELVAGRPPFTGDDPVSIISQHLQVPPVAPHWYNAQVFPELEGIILKLLAKDPAERYASARDVLTALEGLPAAPPSPEEAPPVHPALLLGTVLRTRLAGRDAELRELKTSIELAASGHGRVVLVEGEPGIGKTRLLQEAQVYARLRRFTVLLGRCYEQETGIPYLPFIEMFQGRFRGMDRAALLDELGPAASEFVKLIPDVGKALPDAEVSPPLEPVQERLRVFSSIADYFRGLSRRGTAVVVLEDLHWADAASLSLLQHLARSLQSERMLILGSYRDVELDRKHPLADALREMNRERLYSRVSLRRLSRDGVGAMMRGMFELDRVSDEFLDLLYRETEGNPFFVEEVLKSLVEEGALYREGGRWQRKEIAEIEVPQSIKEVIGRRLERISDPCQRALSLAAVIGRRFRFEVLQEVGELQEEDLLQALEEAMRTQLIREESDAGEVEYDFVHALIREVLYERLSLRRRMTFHQKIGETLERQYANRLDAAAEDLSHHFTRAPHGAGLEKAIEYSSLAGRKSMGVFAHEEAVRYYQNAAELLTEVNDEARLAETRIALGDSYAYLGDTGAAVAAYERALQFFERRGASGDVARAHRRIGSVLQRHWNFSEAIPHLERALDHLDPHAHLPDVIQTHLDLARALTFTGKLDEGEVHAKKALELSRQSGDLAKQAEAHATLGLIAHNRVDLEAATAHSSEAVALAKRSSDPEAYYTLGRSLNNLALYLQERGDYAEAIRLLHEALEASKRARDVAHMGFANVRLAVSHYWMGDWQSAGRHISDNLQSTLSGSWREASEHLSRRLDGDVEAAVSINQRMLEHNRATGALQPIFISSALLAQECLELGRIKEAQAAAAEAGSIVESSPQFFLWPTTGGVLEALARGGDHERCEALCMRGENVSRGARSPIGLAGALYGRAVLALKREDPGAAIGHLQECLPLVVELPVHRSRILLMLARALLRRNAEGDSARARESLGECLALLERMGDTRKAAQVRTELGSLP
jgi:tetratricopeptide (TPR) repeat protein